jgi:hypothetical protein
LPRVTGGGAIDALPAAMLGLGPLNKVDEAVPEAAEVLDEAIADVLAAIARLARGAVVRGGGTMDCRGPKTAVPMRESREVGLRAIEGRVVRRAADTLLGLFF